MFDKIKNPNATAANIALAILYVVVLAALFANATGLVSDEKADSERTVLKNNNL